MSSITEQFSAATKSQWEAQLHILNTLASTAVDSAEKVIALNISTTKASVEKSSAAAKQLLAIKDPQELFSLSAAQPGNFDALLAYGRELVSIATSAQAELVKSAQSTLKQVTDLAATKATLPTATTATAKAAPPVLAAAVSAAISAANEPIAAEAETVPKLPKAKPLAAPIPEQEDFIEVKATLKPIKAAPKAKK